MEISPWLVLLLGLMIVFFGLICLIAIISILRVITSAMAKKKAAKEAAPAPAAPAAPVAPAAAKTPVSGEFLAAVSAALGEELGTDVKGIRILSIKQL